DERLESSGVPVALGIGHGRRYGRIVGYFQEEDLRRRGLDDRCEPAGARRHAPFHEATEAGEDLTAAPQRGGNDRAGERPVARAEALEDRVADRKVEQYVERLTPEHAVEEPRCRASRPPPGIVDARSRSRRPRSSARAAAP